MHAQWKPDRPIEIIVGITPGGPADVMGRMIQQIVQDKRMVGVPVSVLNKTGGNNSIAWTYLNQHAGDGHYIAMTLPNIVSNRILGAATIGHTDITPLAQLNSEPIVFSVLPDSPIANIKVLAERLRTDPASVSFGFSNIGSANHIAAAMLLKAAGADLKKARFVVFKGASEAIPQVLGGHVSVMVSSASTIATQVESGSLKLIAAAAHRRLSGRNANVPTLRESGLNAAFSNWRGVIGPRNMSAAQIAYWDALIAGVVQTDEWQKENAKHAWEHDYLNAAAAKRFLASQHDELRPLLAELGPAK